MSDAPERIWIDKDSLRMWFIPEDMKPEPGDTEYIRADRIDGLEQVYRAADRVAMFIGLNGEINSRHEAVDKLMDALHNLDCGNPPEQLHHE